MDYNVGQPRRLSRGGRRIGSTSWLVNTRDENVGLSFSSRLLRALLGWRGGAIQHCRGLGPTTTTCCPSPDRAIEAAHPCRRSKHSALEIQIPRRVPCDVYQKCATESTFLGGATSTKKTRGNHPKRSCYDPAVRDHVFAPQDSLSLSLFFLLFAGERAQAVAPSYPTMRCP